VVNTILEEADLFCPNSVRINFTIYLNTTCDFHIATLNLDRVRMTPKMLKWPKVLFSCSKITVGNRKVSCHKSDNQYKQPLKPVQNRLVQGLFTT
ncbi:hypothetical protein, partial [Lactiplantibacillus plantarum]|uniref:hypothetical protein n=1 Tax=Lactiplantibacillus plantarum TaxID=1590 RepID=UPI001BA981FA